MSVPDHVSRLIKETNLKYRQGAMDVDSIDSHALFNRERVAAAIALLHGRVEISELDWDLSEVIMAHSDAVRDEVSTVNTTRRHRRVTAEAQEKGRLKVITKQAESEHNEKTIYSNARHKILKLILKNEQVSNRDLANALTKPQREYKNQAIDALINEKLIEKVQTEHGAAYRRI